ncbi:MAG TPA: hypothetical protein VF142_23480 [Longimicrobium sp.]
MNLLPVRRTAALAALALWAGAAAPAAAQQRITGFARSDQSDASGVSLTSADLLGFEPGTIKTFSCPVAWGVRSTSDSLRAALSAPGARADLRALLDGGPGAGDAGARLMAALSRDNSGQARRLARGLVPRLRGLLAASSRMDPAHPGELAATRLNASVTQFNRFVTASSPAFLQSPPAEMTALHGVLASLVRTAEANEGRVADAGAPVASGGLACAPPPPVTPRVVLPPPVPGTTTVRICMVQDGWPREITAQVDPVTNDTTYDGQALSAAFPADAYAGSRAFYVEDHPVTFNGRRYVKYGTPRVLAPGDVTRAGEFMGVPVLVQAGATGTPEVLYVPVRAECEFQPYQLEVKTGGVRGGA